MFEPCPLTNVFHTCCTFTDELHEVDAYGDEGIPYPKLSLMRLEQTAEEAISISKGANSTLIKEMTHMTNVNIMWYVKKWIVSKEHEQDFDASITTPTVTSGTGKGETFKYTCQLCRHWHMLDTWGTQTVKLVKGSLCKVTLK